MSNMPTDDRMLSAVQLHALLLFWEIGPTTNDEMLRVRSNAACRDLVALILRDVEQKARAMRDVEAKP